MRKILFVGYHTAHEEYIALAKNKISSVEEFGFETYEKEYETRGKEHYKPQQNWVLNCAICPEFMRDIMLSFKHEDCDFVYLDADAEMIKIPEIYLDDRHYDFAAPFLSNNHVQNELQSSHMYFANNEKVFRLVNEWCRVQKERTALMLANSYSHPYREAWDQLTLQIALKNTTDIDIYELPYEYSKILPTKNGYEIMPGIDIKDCVITQAQASRIMRSKVI